MEGDDSLLMVSLGSQTTHHSVHTIINSAVPSPASMLSPSPIRVGSAFHSHALFNAANQLNGCDLPDTPPYMTADGCMPYMTQLTHNPHMYNTLLGIDNHLVGDSSPRLNVKCESFDITQQLAVNIPSSNSNSNPSSLHSNPISQSGQNRPFSCCECNKSFANNSALVKHKLIHSDERRFACNICNKSFKRQDHLTGHMNVHKDVKPFQCVIVACEKSYCDARSLKRHLEHGHHLVNASVSSMKGVMYVKYGENDEFKHALKIETSPLPANDNEQRTRHSSGNSSGSGAVSSEQQVEGYSPSVNRHREPRSPVECNQCGRQFKNTPALNGHMRLHSVASRTHALNTKHNNNNNINTNNNSIPDSTNITNGDELPPCDFVTSSALLNTVPHNALPPVSHHQIFTQATMPYVSDLYSNFEMVQAQIDAQHSFNINTMQLTEMDNHVGDVNNMLSSSNHGTPNMLTLPLVNAQNQSTMQTLTNCLGIQFPPLENELDDDCISSELAALTNGVADAFNTVDAHAMHSNDMFCVSSNVWPSVMSETSVLPERRRHPTAPSALAECRLKLSPGSEETAVRRRFSPGEYGAGRPNPPKTRGKPENVCQILRKCTSPKGKTQGFYGVCGRPRKGAAGTRIKAKSGNTHRRVSEISECDNGVKRKSSHLPPLNLHNINRYPSQLRSPRLWERTPSDSGSSGGGWPDVPPYTPPPILSPLRQGSGLFWKIQRQLSDVSSTSRKASLHCETMYNTNFALQPPKSAPINGHFLANLQCNIKPFDDAIKRKDIFAEEFQTFQALEIDTNLSDDLSAPETDTRPHINVGEYFQAKIPDFVGHNDDCEVYRKENDLSHEMFNPKSISDLCNSTVEDYLKLACSKAMIGGGRNQELALHILHRNNGNVQKSLVVLMNGELESDIDYSYVDNVFWSPMEIQLFQKTLLNSGIKDFTIVAAEMCTKTVNECVQFYYTWKRAFSDEYRKTRALWKKKDNENVCDELYVGRSYNLRSSTRETGRIQEQIQHIQIEPEATKFFPCKVCTKVFEKVKSRNAHMKSHNRKERL